MATDRARYIATREARHDRAGWADSCDSESTHALNNNDRLLDWAAGNVNWSDGGRGAVWVQEPLQAPPAYRDGRMNGDEIVRK